eukprot:scaffold568_cov376-Prasinococcus_capsulatus_cf.AAC.6
MARVALLEPTIPIAQSPSYRDDAVHVAILDEAASGLYPVALPLAMGSMVIAKLQALAGTAKDGPAIP